MNIQQHRERIIAESYGVDIEKGDFLEKGKKANVGEIRDWNGEKWQKQPDGEWVPVAKSDKKGSSVEYYEVFQDASIGFFTKDKPDFPFKGKVENVHGGGYNYLVNKKDTPLAIQFIKQNKIKSYDDSLKKSEEEDDEEEMTKAQALKILGL